MEETITSVDKVPYFITQIENNRFGVVSSIKNMTNESGRLLWEINEFKEGSGELILGMDITETANRNLSYIIRVPKGRYIMPYVLEKARTIAEFSDHNYFSFETFGEYFMHCIGEEGNRNIYEIIPRLFRNVPLDDRM
ncbi:MAG: hypothetical protein PHH54_06830 [Candidatus Nanoarchaeia archaeon]|nr:hypothetical protein [Candidatus Nanoarchaeia archaeon]MDD5741670.1 hypothetical protein [Candidatus Nanoarchaeia archaeon]